MTDRQLRYAARVQVWNQKKCKAAGGIVHKCRVGQVVHKIGRQMEDPDHIDTNPEGNYWWIWLRNSEDEVTEGDRITIEEISYTIEEVNFVHRRSGTVLLK